MAFMTTESEAAASLLDALGGALDAVVQLAEDGAVASLTSLQVVDFLRRFERVRNRMALVDHAVLADADRRGLAQALTHANLKSLLVHSLRLSPGEASRRVRAAAAVGERVSALGEVLGPIRPHLAAAQHTGDVSPEQTSVVERALEAIEHPGLDRIEVDRAEQTLARHALTFGPQELRRIATHLIDVIRPDGTVPDERLVQDRRDFRLSRLSDGSFRVEGRLTPALGTQLCTILSPLAKPRLNSATTPDGTSVEVPDDRTYGQRLHDALDDACGRLLRAGGLPSSGGTPATVIVTISADALLSRLGHGVTTDGTTLSVADTLRLAGEAEVLPAVLSSSGVLLELGHSRRVANQNQTYALIARNGGCSFRGWSHPPEWCDRHHIRDWLSDGLTNVDNLTLLCRHHHTHFLGHSWTCRLTKGRPEWTPPRWVDPLQRPLVNVRIAARHVLGA